MKNVENIERNDVLDLDGAAEYLKLSTQTVLKLAKNGSIPATRLGRQWRFSRRQLLERIEGKTA